jgi:hypothetical protein
LGIIHGYPQLTLLGTQNHRLPFHAPHHVEGRAGLAPQGHLEDVVLDALLQRFAKLCLHLKITVCGAQTPNALVGTLVVVVLHPQANAVSGILEAGELGATQVLGENGLPEPLYLPKRHRVVGLALDMLDLLLGQFLLEPGGPAPVGVLPAVVSQHLSRRVVLGHGPAVHLKQVLRRLAAVQLQANDIAGEVVDEPQKVGVAPTQTEGEDVGLPQLVGGTALEETRTGHVALRLGLAWLYELLFVQRSPHRLRAARQKEHAA